MRRALAVLVILGALLAVSPARADKTDTVIMRNGDHITCEIKWLGQSKLTVKTDDMGTIDIKWDKISRLMSHDYFLVRTISGFLHYGFFADSGRDSVLVVAGPIRAVELEMAVVVTIEPIKSGFWDMMTITAALGYNYSKSTSDHKFYFNTTADYRAKYRRIGGSIVTDVTANATEVKRRYDAEVHYSRVVSGKLFAIGSTGARRHDELNLDLRLRLGGGVGYRLVDTRSTALATTVGVYGTREWPADSDEVGNALEGMLGVAFSVFRYDTPKTDIRVKAAVMPSFTVSDRVRWELDLAVSREMFKDFFLELSYFESRDNKPQGADEAASDRGVIFALRWSKS